MIEVLETGAMVVGTATAVGVVGYGVYWLLSAIIDGRSHDVARELVDYKLEFRDRTALEDRKDNYEHRRSVAARLNDISATVDANAKQHNALLATVESTVNEAVAAANAHVDESLAEMCRVAKENVSGVKGHVDQVKVDLQRVHGQIATLPARLWVERLERDLCDFGRTASKASTAAAAAHIQTDKDRLQIERLQAELASLTLTVQRNAEDVGQDVQTLTDALGVLAARTPAPKAKTPRKRAR